MTTKKDNLVKMQCTKCKAILHFTYRNKKQVQKKLELKKYCKKCRKHEVHKEMKK